MVLYGDINLKVKVSRTTILVTLLNMVCDTCNWNRKHE